MSNKITLFVSISLFVILSAFVVLSKDQGKYKITLVLNDGQTVLLDSILTKFPDNSISENFSSINLSSAILRSFDSDTNNINDFKIYVNDLLINKYVDYWQVTPNSNSRLSDFRYIFEENNSDFNWEKIAGFGYYYHNLFRSKSARTVLFKKALDFIEVMCRIYPIDFKKRVLIELESLLKFTNTIKFISLNNDIEYEDYWEGFIVRRHFIDNVPVLEIQNSILEAINRIKNMTPTNTFNALYEINVNNQIAVFYSGEGSYISSLNGTKKFTINSNETIKSIRFLKDLSGDYYQITTTYDSGEKRYLISKNLEPIF
jgi:hypothetical protein